MDRHTDTWAWRDQKLIFSFTVQYGMTAKKIPVYLGWLNPTKRTQNYTHLEMKCVSKHPVQNFLQTLHGLNVHKSNPLMSDFAYGWH
jgi:hypothetical protein